jgi:hypothetical protein
MATRYIRNSAILAKTEVTYGTDPTPDGTNNAILVSGLSLTQNSNNVDRDLIRSYMGGSEQLTGTRSIDIAFDVELAAGGNDGDLDLLVKWDPLIKACGFGVTTNTGICNTYKPISTAIPSVTIYYYADGVLYKALGCRGTFDIKMGLGERPVMSYKFTGLDGGATAVSNPSLTLSAFTKPSVITDFNTSSILIGDTEISAAGILSSGTAYNSKGIQLTIGNDLKYIPLIGDEKVEITNRQITGSLSLDLTAAQEAALRLEIIANTSAAIGFQHGSDDGHVVIVYAPVAQRLNLKHEDADGIIMCGMDLRLVPSSGNDEISIVTR